MDKIENSSSGHRKNKKRHRKRGHKNKSNTSANNESTKTDGHDVKDNESALELAEQITNLPVDSQVKCRTLDACQSALATNANSTDANNCSSRSEKCMTVHQANSVINEIVANDVHNTLCTSLKQEKGRDSSVTVSKTLNDPSTNLKGTLSTCPFLESLKVEEELHPLAADKISSDIHCGISSELKNKPETNKVNNCHPDKNLISNLSAEFLEEHAQILKVNKVTELNTTFFPVVDSKISTNSLPKELASTSQEQNLFTSDKSTEVSLSSIETIEKVVDALTNSLEEMEKKSSKISTYVPSKKTLKNNSVESESPEKAHILNSEKPKDCGDESVKGKKRNQEKKMIAEFPKAVTKDGPTPNTEKVPTGKSDTGVPQKSKAELRAERRAIQEAQRAAKAALKDKSGTSATSQNAAAIKSKPPSESQIKDLKMEAVKKTVSSKPEKKSDKQSTSIHQNVQFFGHLKQFKQDRTFHEPVLSAQNKIHSAIIQLGLQYRERIIVGSNARCVALLHALKQVIADYITPPNKELHRDLEEKINNCMTYLQHYRPLSVSMENAVKFLKCHITQMLRTSADAEAKTSLQRIIDSYINEKIILSDKAIADYALSVITENEVILIFGHSSVVNSVLIHAHKQGRDFHVIVVDSRPKREGKESLITLVKEGIKCSYVLINALSYAMQQVTKVFLGAHALLANGYVMGRVGSSQVALVAKKYNIPVLVCCETHKFSDQVHTDSFVYNELGNPEELIDTSQDVQHLKGWQSIPSLNLLNFLYDVTPPELVSVVVTEYGMLPCTSVPVVLRVKHAKS